VAASYVEGHVSLSEAQSFQRDVQTLEREVSERNAIIVERNAIIVERDGMIATLRSLLASLEGQVVALQSALINHATEIEILKRRLFGPRTERGGTSELQLLLGDMLAQHAALQKQLDDALAKKREGEEATPAKPPPPPPPPSANRPKPKGRRDLSVSSLPTIIVELTDPELAKQGKIIGYEESRQLMFERGGFKVLVKRTPKYELEVAGKTTVLGMRAPKTLFARGLLHTSALAWLGVQKFSLGLPCYRLEQDLADQGQCLLDRGTMCRNLEEVGNVLGATVVHAMMRDAIENCSVLSTDATGAAIQPGPREGGPKQACKKGHFFTIVGDCDYVLFVYTEKHTQQVVANMFQGFRGFLQADASSVYDILDRGPPEDTEGAVVLVGCWAHLRRYFFEAAICKYAVGVEGLTRIRAVYTADNALAQLPPVDRKRAREATVVPLVDAFFEWVHRVARTTPGRNLATKALGYAANQEQELRRVFLDGRIPLDNTRSERALRRIVVGRKSWLFYGSDVHAEAAAAFFSVIASCRLHRLDPWKYLDELLRVLPYWPKERHLELAPKYWLTTRARIDAAELAAPVGVIAVPPLVAA
jgi:transposase